MSGSYSHHDVEEASPLNMDMSDCPPNVVEWTHFVADWVTQQQRTEPGRKRLSLIAAASAGVCAGLVVIIGATVIFSQSATASGQHGLRPNAFGSGGGMGQNSPGRNPNPQVLPDDGPNGPSPWNVVTTAGPTVPPTAAPLEVEGYFYLPGYNCFGGSEPVTPGMVDAIGAYSTKESCRLRCDDTPGCAGFIYGRLKNPHQCWLRTKITLFSCDRTPGRDASDFDFWMKKTPVAEDVGSTAPLQEFYMYRATAPGAFGTYEFGQVNTGNLDGVIWYLQNEIVTNYSNGPRCPRRFGIAELHRVKVKVKATSPLKSAGMNFGPRWAYDQGKCEGRCFPGNMCTGEGDCAEWYNKYGFNIGCNRFASKWPFPDMDTSAPNGVWYSLPLEGRCDGMPTGAGDCTWSYEHTGMVTLEELESEALGGNNCCGGRCTSFWHDVRDTGATYWRIGMALDLFKKKFPEFPPALKDPWCDFKQWKFYSKDFWKRHDPWH